MFLSNFFSNFNVILGHSTIDIYFLLFFGLVVFSSSLASIVYNSQNYLLVLIGLELLLLSVSLLFIFISIGFQIIAGFIYCLVLLALAGIETAIGLCLIINVFFLTQTIELDDYLYLKG